MIKIKNGELKKQVLELLERERRYVSVNYVANNVSKHWTHVYAVFLVLEKEGTIKTLKTQNGFFAGIKENPEKPINCGNCRYLDWHDPHYCRLTGNYDVRRDKYTRACKAALPNQKRSEIV